MSKKRLRRRAILSGIKQASGCVDCGYNEHPVALDFDHVRGEKEFTISDGLHRPWRDVLKEVNKCDVVCSNCHRVRTHK